MGPIQRRLVKATLTVVSFPKLTLLISGIFLAVAVTLALTRLNISTDQNNLFDPNVPFFHDYLSFIKQFPENEAIYVFVEPLPGQNPPVREWAAISDDLAAALRAAPQYVKHVENRVDPIAMGANGFLFEDPDKRDAALAGYSEETLLLQQIAEKPGGDALILGTTPIERFLKAMQIGSVADPRFAQSCGFTTTLVRSLNQTLDPARPNADTPVSPNFYDLDDASPRRLGYFYEPDAIPPPPGQPQKYHLLVSVYHNDSHNSLTSISETVEAIRAITRTVAAKHPAFFVGLTGRPALEADEMRTTDNDTRRAEIIAMIVVFLGMIAFLTPWQQLARAATWPQRLRIFLAGLWLALAAEITLGVAIGWTFGWASISVGELNVLSIVFVIALIGIGLDYLVQILTRYRREARRYVRQTAIWARVYRYVSPPISTACLGAAGAFLAMTLTDFRGAAQLGIIAGGGLLLCLLGGYTVLPALLSLFPPKLTQVDESERYDDKPPRITGKNLLGPALWFALLAAGSIFMSRTHFDPDLLNLQSQGLESVNLVRHLSGSWSAVVLSTDINLLRKVRAAVTTSSPNDIVGSTQSILDAEDGRNWLQAHEAKIPPINWADPQPLKPTDLPTLAKSATSLADSYAALKTDDAHTTATALRQLANLLNTQHSALSTQDSVSRLNAWQSSLITSLKTLDSQFRVRPLDFPTLASQLPPGLRSHLVSTLPPLNPAPLTLNPSSPPLTYALYILPQPNDDLWQQANLAAFETEVERRVATVPNAPPVTGITSNVLHTTAAIQHSFYRATAYALILIFILVLIDLRNLRQTLLAISVLLFGLPMLLALMGLLGISWNFANFFGLPILIGAGHEYGVFMIHRYREALHDPRRVWHSWDVSDRALLLCGFITTSSFAFLIPAHHAGVASLGQVMALGTACIYLATLLVVRPILRYQLSRKK